MNEYNLTEQDGVVALMKSSTTEQEWNQNTNKVKEANGFDYPPFWYSAIVLSGVMRETSAKFGVDDKIRIYA